MVRKILLLSVSKYIGMPGLENSWMTTGMDLLTGCAIYIVT